MAWMLIIEDDKGIRDLLQDRLAEHTLTFAACQAEAYEQLHSSPFDLVLLDLQLPRTPSDMKPSNQIGIDILCAIRKRQLKKRGSAMLMPVVVMTAYGSERLSAQVLIENGANDYIPKPFGTGRDLEQKIQRALNGEGALNPTSSVARTVIRLALHPTDAVVRIENLTYRGATHELLRVLADLYVEDLRALKSPDEYRRVPGNDLATTLRISDRAVRTRIVKFRRQVKTDFRDRLGRIIGRNDIIENRRDWNGYRLNPGTVQILAWDQMPSE